MDNFQTTKTVFYEDEHQEVYNVRVPFDFMGTIQDKIEEQNEDDEIEDIVSAATVFDQSELDLLHTNYLDKYLIL